MILYKFVKASYTGINKYEQYSTYLFYLIVQPKWLELISFQWNQTLVPKGFNFQVKYYETYQVRVIDDAWVYALAFSKDNNR